MAASAEDAMLQQLMARQAAAERRYDAAVAKFDAAAAEWKANDDDKREAKLKLLMDKAEADKTKAEQLLDRADQALAAEQQRQLRKHPRSDDSDGRHPAAKRQRTLSETNRSRAFWAACRSGAAKMGQVPVEHGEEGKKETKEFETINMPAGVSLLGLEEYGTSLLVRPHYSAMYDSWMHGKGKDALMGTPGTGKTFFLVYALCRLGLERYEHPIIFQNTDSDCWCFHGDDVQQGDLDSFYRHLSKPECIYLVDGAANSLPKKNVAARIFLAASPNKDVYGSFRKHTGLSPQIGPLCTLLELLAVRAITPSFHDELTDVDVVRAFETTGGVARALKYWAADKMKTPEQQVDDDVATCNLAVCKDAAQRAKATEKGVAHSLFHLHARPGDPRASELRFASPYVQREFVKRFEEARRGELVQFLASAEALPGFPTLRGVLFEGYALRCLMEGGTFKGCELTSDKGRGKEQAFKVPKAAEALFRHLGDVRQVDGKTHHRPLHGSLETVDSFVSAEWLFQVTVAGKHDVKAHGLEAVLARLRELKDRTANTKPGRGARADGDAKVKTRLFFVVPPDVFDNPELYQALQPVTLPRGVHAKQAREAHQVRQFVLRMPLE